MIERFGWLHISDLHLKAEPDTWGQNVVLRELVEDVASRAQKVSPEFIIVSGDLAFSGRDREYVHVEKFLDQLREVLHLPRECVFCVPGNHDIDRSVQKTCHLGAMHLLSSHQEVEEFLGDETERETLLLRQSAYRDFERSYCRSHRRDMTPEGLGFVAPLEVGGLHICVVGLNSAWLCQGGESDERGILVSDRQVIDAIEIVRRYSPSLVLGVIHHPPDWLRHFDQSDLEHRLFPECHILHRGHLHGSDVEIAPMLSGHRCVVIAAGAAFTSRNFRNFYSLVKLDLAESNCEVSTYGYKSSEGRYEALEPRSVEIRLGGSVPGSLLELAVAISKTVPSASGIAYYLAALLRGETDDVLIPLPGQVVFASPNIIDEQVDKQAKRETKDFLGLRNLIRAFPDSIALRHRIDEFKERLSRYAEWLLSLAHSYNGVSTELDRREKQFRALASSTAPGPYQHARLLMKRLEDEGDWPLLELTARKQSATPDRVIALEAKRMLAVSLAHSDEIEKQSEAAEIAASLAREPQRSVNDVIIGITILGNLGRDDAAKQLLLEGLQLFPDDLEGLLEVGRKLALDTGDGVLREALDAAAGGQRTVQ